MEVFSCHAVICCFYCRRQLFFHFYITWVINLNLLNSLRYFIYRSFLTENIRCRLAFFHLWRSNSVLIKKFFLLVESERSSRLNLDCPLLHQNIFILIQIFIQLVHDVLALLFIYFGDRRYFLNCGLLSSQAWVEHKRVDCLLTFAEFALFLLFTTNFVIVIIGFPNLATVVLITESVIIYDEVVVSAGCLSRFIFVAADFFKDGFLFFDLRKYKHLV